MVFTTTADSQVVKSMTALFRPTQRQSDIESSAAHVTELAPSRRALSQAERQITNALMANHAQGHLTDDDMRDFVVRLSAAHGLDHATTMQEFQQFRKTAKVSHHEREAFIAAIRSGVGFSTISYTVAGFQQGFINLMEAHPEWDDATREKFAIAFAYVGPALGFLVTGNLSFMVVSSWINKHGLGSFTHASELAHLKTHSGKGFKKELKAQGTLQLKESQWRAFEIIHTAGAFVQQRVKATPFEYATNRGWIQSPLAGISASLWKSWNGFRNEDVGRLVKMSEPQLRHIASQNQRYHSDHTLLGVKTGPAFAFAKELTVWTADVGKSIFEALHPTQWPAWRFTVSKPGVVGMATFAAGLAIAVPLYGRSNQLTNRALLERAAGDELAAQATDRSAYTWHQVGNGLSLAEVFIYRGWVQNWLSKAVGLVKGAAAGRTPEQAVGAATDALPLHQEGGLSLINSTINAAQDLVALARSASASGSAGERLPTSAEQQKLEDLMGRITGHQNAIAAGLPKDQAAGVAPVPAVNVDRLFAEVSGLIGNAREIVAQADKWSVGADERGVLNTAVDRLAQSFNHHAEMQATQMTPQNLASLAATLSDAQAPEKNILASIVGAGFGVHSLSRQDVLKIMTPILAADPASFGAATAAVHRIEHEALGVAHLNALSMDIAPSQDNHAAKKGLLQLVSDRISPNGPDDLPTRAQLFGSNERFWLVRPWLEHMGQLDGGTQDILVGLVGALRNDRTFGGSDRVDMDGYVSDLPANLRAKFGPDNGSRA
jgi:hypothetical protein